MSQEYVMPFNEGADLKLDQKISSLDLISMRMEIKRYTGATHTTQYWIIAQEQDDGTYDASM